MLITCRKIERFNHLRSLQIFCNKKAMDEAGLSNVMVGSAVATVGFGAALAYVLYSNRAKR